MWVSCVGDEPERGEEEEEGEEEAGLTLGYVDVSVILRDVSEQVQSVYVGKVTK